MDQMNLERISELTRISRERELTEAEQAERAMLRKQYLEIFRGNFKAQLDNTVVEYPDGSRVSLREAANAKKK